MSHGKLIHQLTFYLFTVISKSVIRPWLTKKKEKNLPWNYSTQLVVLEALHLLLEMNYYFYSNAENKSARFKLKWPVCRQYLNCFKYQGTGQMIPSREKSQLGKSFEFSFTPDNGQWGPEEPMLKYTEINMTQLLFSIQVCQGWKTAWYSLGVAKRA